MEKFAIVIDCSCILIGFLLLVSDVIFLKSSKKTHIEMSSLIFLRIKSFLTESPRWLLTKGREAAAYRIVFNQKFDMEFSEKATKAKEVEKEVRFFVHH